MIAVVDYGLCNLDSIGRALVRCGAEPSVTSDPTVVRSAGSIVLPGVGSFALAMERLVGHGLAEAIREAVLERHVPFLGICLGMQLMAEIGTEGGVTSGLALLPGRVERMVVGSTERLPHIGWNEVRFVQSHPLLTDVPECSDFYFVHSFHFKCEPFHVLATTDYASGFASVIGCDHIVGVQFHPEKSQHVGFQVLRNFLTMSALQGAPVPC